MMRQAGCGRWLVLLLSVCCLSAWPAGQATTATPPSASTQGELLLRLADDVAREVEQLRGWKFKRPVRKERIPVARARQDIYRMLLAADKPAHRARVQAFLLPVHATGDDLSLRRTAPP